MINLRGLFFLISIISIILVSGCTTTQKEIVDYKGIDGKVKQIDITGKSFLKICTETFGTWMAEEDGMMEKRNGREIGTKPCSGCMTDSQNMFCNKADYINAIKIG